MDDLRMLGNNVSAPITKGEMSIVIYRYMEHADDQQELMDKLAKQDMPYRSKSWVKKVVCKIMPQLESIIVNNNDMWEEFKCYANQVFPHIDTWEECLSEGGTCQP
jgi:hypothetical protein